MFIDVCFWNSFTAKTVSIYQTQKFLNLKRTDLQYSYSLMIMAIYFIDIQGPNNLEKYIRDHQLTVKQLLISSP